MNINRTKRRILLLTAFFKNTNFFFNFPDSRDREHHRHPEVPQTGDQLKHDIALDRKRRRPRNLRAQVSPVAGQDRQEDQRALESCDQSIFTY